MSCMKPRPIPPKVQDYLGKPGFDLMKVLQAAGPEANRTDRYLNWEELRYRHVPEGISCEEWWVGIRFHRMQARRDTPILAANGDPFTYAYTNLLVENLHRIDLSAGGTMGGGRHGRFRGGPQPLPHHIHHGGIHHVQHAGGCCRDPSGGQGAAAQQPQGNQRS